MKHFASRVLAGLGLLLALSSASLAQRMQPPIQPVGLGCAYNSSPPTLTTGWVGWAQCDSAGKLIVSTSQYPSGAIPISASATGTTGATTATLAAHATKTTYICGFTIGADATAVAVGTATVTGTITGTLSFRQAAAAAAAGTTTLTVPMSPCIPGSAVNTGLAVISIAAGSGGNTAVSAWGFQL